MQKTAAEIAKLKKITRQAVNDFISKNSIQPAGKKGAYPSYDCSAEPLAGYLAKSKPPPEQSDDLSSSPHFEPPETPDTCPSPQEAAGRIPKPLNDLLIGRIPPGRKPSTEFYLKALKIADVNQDAALLFKLGQMAAKEDADEIIRLQALETEQAKKNIAQGRAERIRLENEIRRDEYISKSVIKTLFGRVYAVHTSILTPLSLKLSSTLAAIPPGDEKEATMKKLIDDEVFAALEMIKLQLVEYVTGRGEEVVDKSE